ncbi:MAG: hypothetical protein WBO97_05255 [Tepidiformaceae bacterium]
MKLRYLISLSLVGALLLGACGGGDDDDDSAKTPTDAATSTAASDATKTADQPTTPAGKTAEATKTGNTSGSSNSDFDKLAKAALSKNYEGTYDLELTLNDTVQKGTAIYAIKSPKFVSKLSLDAGALGSLKFTVINDGKDVYTCTDIGTGGKCSKDTSTLGTAPDGVNIQKAIQEATSGQDVKEVDKRTIMGRSARCFEAKDPGSDDATTYCFDSKDSSLLALEIGGNMKMTATKISTSVDDKLFELPYPVN